MKYRTKDDEISALIIEKELLAAEIDSLQQRRIEIGEQNAKLFVAAKNYKEEIARLRELLQEAADSLEEYSAVAGGIVKYREALQEIGND